MTNSVFSVRGTGFARYLPTFKRLYGAEKADQVLERLTDPSFRSEVRNGVFRTKWYPFTQVGQLLDAMEGVAGNGNGDVARLIGKECALEDLSGFLKIVVEVFGTPHMLASRAASVWRNFYEDAEFVILDSGPNTIRCEQRGFPVPHRNQCMAVAGWLDGALIRTKVKDPHVEHVSCRAKGDAACVFVGTWKP